jgi:hypothetical protein
VDRHVFEKSRKKDYVFIFYITNNILYFVENMWIGQEHIYKLNYKTIVNWIPNEIKPAQFILFITFIYLFSIIEPTNYQLLKDCT